MSDNLLLAAVDLVQALARGPQTMNTKSDSVDSREGNFASSSFEESFNFFHETSAYLQDRLEDTHFARVLQDHHKFMHSRRDMERSCLALENRVESLEMC